MTGLESIFNTLPGHWALIALIAGIGLSVVFLRGLIRIVFRVLIIGAFGVILLGVLYAVMNYFGFSL